MKRTPSDLRRDIFETAQELYYCHPTEQTGLLSELALLVSTLQQEQETNKDKP